MSKNNHDYILGLCAVLAFSLTLPITKYLTPFLTIWEIGFGRSLLAAVAGGIILLATKQALPTASQIFRLLIVASGISFGFPVLTAVGMQSVPSSHGGIILGGLPLFTALIGCLIAKERPTILFVFVAIAGFLTIALYSLLSSGGAGDLALYKGDLALFGAVVLASLGYAQGGILAREMGGWQVICWTLVVSIPLLLPLTIAYGNWSSFQQLSITGWGAFAFLALINSLIGFFFWYKALALGGVPKISQIQLLQTFFTFGFAKIWLGEEITPLMMVFMVLTIIIVWISKRITSTVTLK